MKTSQETSWIDEMCSKWVGNIYVFMVLVLVHFVM